MTDAKTAKRVMVRMNLFVPDSSESVFVNRSNTVACNFSEVSLSSMGGISFLCTRPWQWLVQIE